jgi:preprotein translocase subunit SecA
LRTRQGSPALPVALRQLIAAACGRVDGDVDEPAAALESGSAEPESALAITAKGLGPARPTKLEYSAPSIDGEAGLIVTEEEFDEIPELGPDASRAERRRAERAMRKRDEKQR